jgi:uncharacterized ParB-like nuclease family protein
MSETEQKVEIASLNNELNVRSVGLDLERVTLFESLIESGVYLPPVTVYKREGRTFLLDGRHRVEAYKRLGKVSVCATEVPYTTRVQMYICALSSNMTKRGVPLPPTQADFCTVIRELSREGITKLEAIKMLEHINVPTVFAKKLVNATYHSIRKLDELHAAEAIKAKRMTIQEAAVHYSVPVKVIHRKLLTEGGYGVPQFSLDFNKKMRTLQKFLNTKLKDLEDSGSRALAGEALKVSVKKELELFGRFVDSKIVVYR